MKYVLDDNNNKIEAYDKEEVLAVLEQAIKDGSLAGITADSGFITKIRSFVTGETNKIAFITQAKYNELEAAGELIPNAYYYITDDTTADDINSILNSLLSTTQNLVEKTTASEEKIAKIESGETVVPKATEATRSTNSVNSANATTAAKITLSENSGKSGKIYLQKNALYSVRVTAVVEVGYQSTGVAITETRVVNFGTIYIDHLNTKGSTSHVAIQGGNEEYWIENEWDDELGERVSLYLKKYNKKTLAVTTITDVDIYAQKIAL